jgi:surface polysaccharide O-acyltransferase-like enzyme
MSAGKIRNVWVDYLRSAITVLVVAHHSSLAYTTFAKFDSKAYINSTHPIVDTHRWIGLDIFENFNDIFFMSLMFMIGGFFLMKSIQRKGAAHFIKDRFYRLFVPFIFLGTLFMLIAYFPSHHVGHPNAGVASYVVDFFTIEKWPVGPPWFIWVLFAFNFLFAIFSLFFQKLAVNLGNFFSQLKSRPLLFFIFVFAVTWILYVPLAYNVGQGRWVGIGPFDFQLSRILLYFGYFLLGVFIGNTNFNTELFSTTCSVVKKWWLWVALAITVYAFLTILSNPLTELVNENRLSSFEGWMIYYGLYAASCALSSIAFITTFRKFANRENRWWDSLSANAYMVYLVHFIFVIWMQYLLLETGIPAFAKFLITFLVAISLSWLASILLRKVKIIRRYI